jgi:hypothetical protein
MEPIDLSVRNPTLLGFGKITRDNTDHDDERDVTEKRATRRHKVLKGATIAFDGNGVACTVRNLSPHGAALDLASSVILPASFMLLIEADQFIRRCHPVWSHEKRIGVAFD